MQSSLEPTNLFSSLEPTHLFMQQQKPQMSRHCALRVLAVRNRSGSYNLSIHKGAVAEVENLSKWVGSGELCVFSHSPKVWEGGPKLSKYQGWKQISPEIQ